MHAAAWPQARLAGTDSASFFGGASWSWLMSWMNSSRLLPARRGFQRRSSRTLVLVISDGLDTGEPAALCVVLKTGKKTLQQ